MTIIGIERASVMYAMCRENWLLASKKSPRVGCYLLQGNAEDLDLRGAASLGRYCGSSTSYSNEEAIWADIWRRFFSQDGALFGWDTKLSPAKFATLDLEPTIAQTYNCIEIDGQQGSSRYAVYVWVRLYQHRKLNAKVSTQLSEYVALAKQTQPPDAPKVFFSYAKKEGWEVQIGSFRCLSSHASLVTVGKCFNVNQGLMRT
jgi:hypothetical protein